MYFAEDENIARYLQNEFDYFQKRKEQTKESPTKENQNPVASILEVADPTPSIHDLFVKFDKKFFWSSLGMVQVLWSNKMYTCAGVCRFQGRLGACTISLSAPLLSFRPRKDLVETLLHEMIHAYLFVTNNYRDRDDHGPEFHKHMYRINNEAGTNITVYHSFHDEVDYYRQHIWRCNGPCQFRKPYFGFIKRAQNRAPGPNDNWWSKHQLECNGTFVKIAEPEKKIRKSKNSKVTKVETNTKDIRNFVQQIPNSKGKSSNVVTLADFNKTTSTGFKSGTITVVNKKSCDKTEKDKNKLISKTDNKCEANTPKIKNTKLPNSSNKKPKKTNNAHIPDSVLEEYFTNKISTSKNVNVNVKNTACSDSEKVKETVRNIWCNKFLPKLVEEKVESKKIKLECDTSDDEPKNKIKNHTIENNISSEAESICDGLKNNSELKQCPICNENVLQSEMNEHLENCVNCSFVNSNNLDSDDDDDGNDIDFDGLEKNKNVQEFEEDKECKGKKNDIKNMQKKEENEISCYSLSCPCCGRWYLESEMNSHLDECLTLIALKEEAEGNL